MFDALGAWLVNKRFSLRQLFWITGLLAFFISPMADNLTTALVICTVITTISPNNLKFISLSAINIVVAANSGGSFSPFGDITTLMVWQANMLNFTDFFRLFIPAIVSFLIPAIVMTFFIEKHLPPVINKKINLKFGAKRIIFLFLITIILAVSVHQLLHLPPVIGMMTGLGLLKIFGFYIRKHEEQLKSKQMIEAPLFDVFKNIKQLEWDTLLFFYGIMLSIGGLAAIGYLAKGSTLIYSELGANLPMIHKQTPANVIVGLLSAIIDNIPIMFSVLTMKPNMSTGQWLLVTLTTGIGCSLLSIGSAAGVALMGYTKGIYSFFSHLKWSWVILLGYIAAIYLHFLINSKLFI